MGGQILMGYRLLDRRREPVERPFRDVGRSEGSFGGVAYEGDVRSFFSSYSLHFHASNTDSLPYVVVAVFVLWLVMDRWLFWSLVVMDGW